mmetsp:Transcript_74028/g.173658  ORF Transcript_74028/g.173658 Transcript_74028/m.173658 type:complete len:922 (+) Transcript_74028:67-2832(+)
MAVKSCVGYAQTLETYLDPYRRKSTNDLVVLGSKMDKAEQPPAIPLLRRSSSGSIKSSEAHLLVYAEKNSTTLTRFRKLLKGLVDAGLTVEIRSEIHELEADAQESTLNASAICVLWSPYFIVSYKEHLLKIAEKAVAQEIRLLNDVRCLIELADRRWALRMLSEHGIPTPKYAECAFEGQCPTRVEEYDDHVIVNGQQKIDKPFLEKPVKRSDREIYLYHPQDHGGGRALFSSIESGDDRYICTFEDTGSVRREGSYIYQEYPKSDGFRVQVVCVGMLYYGYCVVSPTILSSDELEEAAFSDLLASTIQNGHSCVLSLKEKEVAAQLQKIFGQTIFGITFYRSIVNGREESLVTDLWPGVPRWGIIDHFGDVVNELLKEMNFKPRLSLRDRLAPVVVESPTNRQQPRLSRRVSVIDGVELLCVVMLVRHGERTPKQKIKGKLTLSNPFQAGWLCGFLQQEDCLPSSEKAFDMRKKHQLKRLSTALAKLLEQGHKLQQVEEALDCIKRAGMDYRAKVVISDGAALQIKIKWGGELTLKGRSGSQESGKCFRERTFAGEDIAQLHTSLQHDIKIFSSREQRCLQTAAAFAKGLLSLNGALPSIVTELVNTLEDSEWGGPSGVKEGRMSEWQNKPWEEVEELFGFRADDSLRQHATPKEAAMRFAEGVQGLYKELTKQEPVELYMGETVTLMKERYKDVAGDLMDEPSFDMFVTVPHAFDHLVYDVSHNKDKLNESCAKTMQAAFEFSDHLCQVVAAVETMMTADNVPGSTTGFKVFFLNRLQRYLRRAAGLPESPREIVETDKPRHLSSAAAVEGVEPVRSRLFFGHSSWLQGVLTLLFGSSFSKYLPGGVDTAFVKQLRLGFLARVLVRLERHRDPAGLRVVFKFANSDSEHLSTIFNLPFEEVDSWWTNVLQAATAPNLS